MDLSPLRELPDRWRSDAEVLRRCGHRCTADLCDRHAQELDRAVQAHETELITIGEAAAESGYSEDHLRRLVRDEVLPDQRPPGSEGGIRMPLELLRDERDRAIDDPSLPRPGRTSGDSSDRSG